MKRKETIIDRSNWVALKVQEGDFVLNNQDEKVAVVTHVHRRTKIVTVRTIKSSPEFEYELDGGRTGYERLVEFMSYRFLREETTP